MKRFFRDLKKYKNYILYSIKAELKNEVINSYLGSLWLIIEPIAFMLIYYFIGAVVFKSKIDYFPVFVFIGLSIWNFFNKTVIASVKLVSSNKDTVTKVYLPKFVLLLVKVGVNIFKMAVSFALVFICMIIYKVPVSWNLLWFLPIVLISILFTFGICCFVMHFGVFAEDLTNIVNIGLKMMFYLTGVFYDLSTKIHNVFYRTILLDLNPMANFIYNLRNILLNSTGPDISWLSIWFLIGLLLSYTGINTIYKYENTYVKVMK